MDEQTADNLTSDEKDALSKLRPAELLKTEHRQLARQIAQEAIGIEKEVLLKYWENDSGKYSLQDYLTLLRLVTPASPDSTINEQLDIQRGESDQLNPQEGEIRALLKTAQNGTTYGEIYGIRGRPRTSPGGEILVLRFTPVPYSIYGILNTDLNPDDIQYLSHFWSKVQLTIGEVRRSLGKKFPANVQVLPVQLPQEAENQIRRIHEAFESPKGPRQAEGPAKRTPNLPFQIVTHLQGTKRYGGNEKIGTRGMVEDSFDLVYKNYQNKPL